MFVRCCMLHFMQWKSSLTFILSNEIEIIHPDSDGFHRVHSPNKLFKHSHSHLTQSTGKHPNFHWASTKKHLQARLWKAQRIGLRMRSGRIPVMVMATAMEMMARMMTQTSQWLRRACSTDVFLSFPQNIIQLLSTNYEAIKGCEQPSLSGCHGLRRQRLEVPASSLRYIGLRTLWAEPNSHLLGQAGTANH